MDMENDLIRHLYGFIIISANAVKDSSMLNRLNRLYCSNDNKQLWFNNKHKVRGEIPEMFFTCINQQIMKRILTFTFHT